MSLFSKIQLQDWKPFLGKRVLRLLLLSVLAGVVLSLVEILFSMLIQSFLLSMEVIDTRVTEIPEWFPKSFGANMVFLGLAAIIRGFIQWFKVYGHSMTQESFSYHVKSMVANWALLSKNAESSTVVTFLSDRIQNASVLVTAFQNAFIHLFSLALLLAYLLKSSFFLATSGILILSLSALLLKTFDKYVKKAGDRLVLTSTEINQRLLDALKNLLFLKICRAEVRELSFIRKNLDKFFQSNRLFIMIKSCKFAAPQFIGVFVIIAISAFNRQSHALVGGAFVSFVYLFMRTAQTSSDLSVTFAGFKLYSPQFLELYHWWKTKAIKESVPDFSKKNWDEHSSPYSSAELAPTGWSATNLTFGYSDDPIFNKVDINIPAGSIAAITGPSGRGKSTLLSLLGGVLEPQVGSIEVAALSEREELKKALKRKKLRFGYVGPDPYVISGTVRENLVYGLDRQVSDKELIMALDQAYCLEFLKDMPEDLGKTISDRGEGLSTGQKQRLALARALLRNPSTLLLDEPTANLDEFSETKVIEALERLKGKMTLVLVTHRKSLLDIADQKIEL